MNEQQFEAVLALDSFKRYSHFVSTVAYWQLLLDVKSGKGWSVPVALEDFEYFST